MPGNEVEFEKDLDSAFRAINQLRRGRGWNSRNNKAAFEDSLYDALANLKGMKAAYENDVTTKRR